MANAIMINGLGGLNWVDVELTSNYSRITNLINDITPLSDDDKYYVIRCKTIASGTSMQIQDRIYDVVSGVNASKSIIVGCFRRYRNGIISISTIGSSYSGIANAGDIYQYADITDLVEYKE